MKKPEFRKKANKFKPNGHLSAEVSVPNVVRKYACCGNFQTLQKKRAATPEPTLQPKMKKIENEENPNLNPKCVGTFIPKRDKQREVDEWHGEALGPARRLRGGCGGR